MFSLPHTEVWRGQIDLVFFGTRARYRSPPSSWTTWPSTFAAASFVADHGRGILRIRKRCSQYAPGCLGRRARRAARQSRSLPADLAVAKVDLDAPDLSRSHSGVPPCRCDMDPVHADAISGTCGAARDRAGPP